VTATPNTTDWERLGEVAPAGLVDARLELHHAAQLVAAVGASLLERRPDDSHPNLGWSARSRGFVGHTVPGRRPFAAALSPADLTLSLVDDSEEPLAELPLAGHTLEGGRSWLAEQTRALGADAEIQLPDYELPPHAVADGARFEAARERERCELARWFAGAQQLLTAVASEEREASSVRCWPHHFDLATLIPVERDESGAATRTIGVGLSPGDGSYAEPYWYVSPWPYPEGVALPTLPGTAHWHQDGYTAAIARGSDLVVAGPEDAQPMRIREFLNAAVGASRQILSA